MKVTHSLLLGALCLGAGCQTGRQSGIAGAPALVDQPQSRDRSESLAVRGTMARTVPGSPAQAATPGRILAAPADEATSARVDPAARVIIYSAAMRVVVVSVSDSLASVQRLAESLGGYMQEVAGDAITIRVPATRFNEATGAVEKLGEVTERNIKAADITEQMVDLKIRLENAEKGRVRLLELIARTEKAEDLLKIEEQLQRVTAEIESMKGKIRFFESQAAMSTIRVEFNSPRRQIPQDGLGVPFEWINRLGDGLIAGTVESAPRSPGIFGRGPSFVPPPGFVRYYQDDNYVEAMDAGSVRIKVQRHLNHDSADLSFWAKLARRTLVESRSLAVDLEDSVSGVARIGGTREIAGKQHKYLLVLRREQNGVTTFEAWGPVDEFNAQSDAIDASGNSIARR